MCKRAWRNAFCSFLTKYQTRRFPLKDGNILCRLCLCYGCNSSSWAGERERKREIFAQSRLLPGTYHNRCIRLPTRLSARHTQNPPSSAPGDCFFKSNINIRHRRIASCIPMAIPKSCADRGASSRRQDSRRCARNTLSSHVARFVRRSKRVIE